MCYLDELLNESSARQAASCKITSYRW